MKIGAYHRKDGKHGGQGTLTNLAMEVTSVHGKTTSSSLGEVVY
jgi:hypothetical protein